MQLSLVSSLPPSYYNELERLVFFNPSQAHAKGAIVEALDRYGHPCIVTTADGIRLVVNGGDHVQCIFGIARTRRRLALAGMVMYLRASREELVVVHIAVSARYARTKRTSLGVVVPLVRAVRAAAHRLRGVERMSVLYRQGRSFRIRINSPATTDDSTTPECHDTLSCAFRPVAVEQSSVIGR